MSSIMPWVSRSWEGTVSGDGLYGVEKPSSISFNMDSMDCVSKLDATDGDISCGENRGADGVDGCIGSDDFLVVIVNLYFTNSAPNYQLHPPNSPKFRPSDIDNRGG